MFFVTGTMVLFFFVTRQIGTKFAQKNVNRCPLLNISKESWKPLRVILHQTIILGLFWRVFMWQAYKSQVTFFDLAKPSIY